MVNPLPVPLPTNRDAMNRAVRTFLQGLWVDVSAALAVALAVGLTDVRWTKEYWIAFAVMLGKTVAIAVVSYAYRLLKPPPSF